MAGTATHPENSRTFVSSRASGSLRVLLLPIAFTLTLASFGLLPAARENGRLMVSFAATSGALLFWLAALWVRARGRTLTVERSLRAQHYLQACAQCTVLLYWGWAWRPVYDAVPLILAQLVFAYAFDMLLTWSRRDNYVLGFGPFPVIFSINLFLWFKADWFYLQFLMIALGFAAKELIRWNKDGRRVHVFNPSSFPLAVFSIGLILTGTTSWTWGPEIATTQFNPHHIYLVLFLVGLPGQFLFGVTTMTMSAVLTTYVFGLTYFVSTGTYFFIDSYIPVAVFLGMHLLFTDPSTSPRTELGRILFGVLYGLGNVILYELLGRAGVPTFYDKLLPVPIMNLSIQVIDRLARSSWLRVMDPSRIAPQLTGRRRNLAYIGVWSAAFVLLSATEGVGDNHPGHRIPFWQQACVENARNACATLSVILDSNCSDGSSWACNEVGVLRWNGRGNHVEQSESDFQRGCALGSGVSCQNATVAGSRLDEPRQFRPQLADYPVILRTGKGRLPDKTPEEFYARACDQGFLTGCDDLAGMYLRPDSPSRDPRRAAPLLEQACTEGLASACSNLGYMYYSGDGVPADQRKGISYLKRSCELGFQNGCRWLEELPK